jgi:restriction endonuclease Mrr
MPEEKGKQSEEQDRDRTHSKGKYAHVRSKIDTTNQFASNIEWKPTLQNPHRTRSLSLFTTKRQEKKAIETPLKEETDQPVFPESSNLPADNLDSPLTQVKFDVDGLLLRLLERQGYKAETTSDKYVLVYFIFLHHTDSSIN